jgi:hypothetical protein
VSVFGHGRDHQEGVGEHGQGDPAIPGAPAADLVLVQANQALAGLEALLDGPAPPGDSHQRGQRYRLGHEAAVEGQLAGSLVAADQQPVLGSLFAAVEAQECPVVVAVAFRAPASRDALPGPRWDTPEQGVGALGDAASPDRMVAGNRQHIADAAGLKLGPQSWAGAVDLVPATQAAGTPASSARAIIACARAGLVANPTWAGMPAARQRAGSSIQP